MEQEIENVVIVSADSLREKDLKEAPDDEYPFLQKFMNRPGDYYSNASWTVPAHASIFSGKLPSEHGTSSQDMYFKDENKLTQFFSKQEFQNILLSENDLLTAGLGLSDGFDESYRLVRENGVVWNDESWRSNAENFAERWTTFGKEIIKNRDIESAKSFTEKIGEKIFDRQVGEKFNPTYTDQTIQKILEYITQDEKTFIFTNWMITHYDYTFTEKEKEEYFPESTDEEIQKITTSDQRLHEVTKDNEFHKLAETTAPTDEELEIIQKSYKASIKYLDRQLKNLWNSLPENTFLILIGDHGEVIGEKKYEEIPIIEHHFGTFESLIEVPFRYKTKGKHSEITFEKSSHIQLKSILENVLLGTELEEQETVFAEYYAKGGISTYFNQKYPDEFSQLYQRKSFSIIKENYKLDIASDGQRLWKLEDYETEELNNEKITQEIRLETPFVLSTVLDDMAVENNYLFR